MSTLDPLPLVQLTALEEVAANAIRDDYIAVVRLANATHTPKVISAGLAAFFLTIINLSTDKQEACNDLVRIAEHARKTLCNV